MIMGQKQQVYDALEKAGISFEMVEHDAVFTVEEIDKLGFEPKYQIAKNLFLRDAKGKRHFLVTVDAKRPIDIKLLEKMLGSTRLSFASEERLQKHLGLTKGSVSPFGLLNDSEGAVEFYLDEKLNDGNGIGLHPNDNTASVFITAEDLIRFVKGTEHEVKILRFD